jgi:hypothetical protein
MPLAGRSFAAGGQVAVSAQGDTGPIHATAPLKATR